MSRLSCWLRWWAASKRRTRDSGEVRCRVDSASGDRGSAGIGARLRGQAVLDLLDALIELLEHDAVLVGHPGLPSIGELADQSQGPVPLVLVGGQVRLVVMKTGQGRHLLE